MGHWAEAKCPAVPTEADGGALRAETVEEGGGDGTVAASGFERGDESVKPKSKGSFLGCYKQ